MSKVLLLQGNQAVVEGAIASGVKFYGGYPITPSTEIAEQLAARLPQVGGKFMQQPACPRSAANLCRRKMKSPG